jgi:RES domain-containing protein
MRLTVWRICKGSYARGAFDGDGARRFPGRWNRRGVGMVYTASSLSLAALECFVHLDAEDLPADLVSIRATLPEAVRVERIDAAGLPRGWRSVPPPSALQALGSEWVRSGRTVALVVPSAVTPVETNVLLNPDHPDMRKLQAGRPETFAFDPRMRKPSN